MLLVQPVGVQTGVLLGTANGVYILPNHHERPHLFMLRMIRECGQVRSRPGLITGWFRPSAEGVCGKLSLMLLIILS